SEPARGLVAPTRAGSTCVVAPPMAYGRANGGAAPRMAASPIHDHGVADPMTNRLTPTMRRSAALRRGGWCRVVRSRPCEGDGGGAAVTPGRAEGARWAGTHQRWRG